MTAPRRRPTGDVHRPSRNRGNGGADGTGGTGPNGTLAYTGSDPAPVIAFAILLMLAGAGLTIARRFRRA
ncbi:LPXTG cell wall anchor domain-containing protein [Curtobacterium sp. KT1]|uniref:LPXTG cell wall anchor domain-containing protein n=1 Tax=Curtobacterium sp. KT1 TaxID=3372858 RepID=UPI0037BEF0DF